MKKISQQESELQSQTSTHLSLSDALNPQESQQPHCKICFQQKMPLVTLCQCTGSIAYVHEDCILDWIALKMQKSELIQIPQCEICKTNYSAALKIGAKKIDNNLLLQKAKAANKKDWIILFGSLLGYIVAFFTIIVTILHIVIGKAISLETPSDFALSTIKVFFVQILFPIMFMNERVKYFKSKWQILEACKVQLVEVTLLPKKILKA